VTLLHVRAAIFFLLASTPLLGAPTAYVIPVATAHVKDRMYVTTLALRNDGPKDVRCEAIYAIPFDPKGGTLRGTYMVPAGGQPLVDDDVLRQAGVVGTMRLACSGEVVVITRIQSSADEGVNFDSGWTFAGMREDGAISRGKPKTFTALHDVVVAEVAGKPVTVEIIARNAGGVEFGRKTYEILPFLQKIVEMSNIHVDLEVATVELRIIRGEGAIVAADENRDPQLIKMAERRSNGIGKPLTLIASHKVSANTTTTSGPSITQMLLISPFKGASLQDPLTGLILMRDRWYDPKTGTFISPDPEGNRDSANLYSFCHGDPVNCSDPTGRAAVVSQKRWIGGRRPNGTSYRFAPEYARQHPAEVQGALESDADLSRADVARLMVQARLPMRRPTSACRRGETCISAVPNARYGAADYALGPAVSALNSLMGFMNQVNRVNGQQDVPFIPYASERQWWAGDRFDEVQLAFTVPAIAAGGVNAMEVPSALTARVFRVEGMPNTRILIGGSGQVTVIGDDMLFLNFGSRSRAEAFFARRLEQGMPSVVIKEFDVPYSFLEDLRSAAVPERLARQFPDRPILVDPTKAPDQFGLRPDQIRALQRAVVPGSGTTDQP
jgi:RHS repeat-associated protein